MHVEIGAETVRFLFWEYINSIFVAVCINLHAKFVVLRFRNQFTELGPKQSIALFVLQYLLLNTYSYVHINISHFLE
jgi:hypothetical protein